MIVEIDYDISTNLNKFYSIESEISTVDNYIISKDHRVGEFMCLRIESNVRIRYIRLQ